MKNKSLLVSVRVQVDAVKIRFSAQKASPRAMVVKTKSVIQRKLLLGLLLLFWLCVLNQDCDPFCLLLLRTVVVVVVVFAPSARESRLIQCLFCKFTVILRYIFVFR